MINPAVSPQKIKPWQGILMILAILALLLLATVAVNLLGRRVEPIWGQLAVLLVTGLGAYALMRNYVLEYQYTVSQGSFYIERLYGQRTKVMLQVPLSDILFLGQDKAAAAKWPQARIMIDATLSRPLEPHGQGMLRLPQGRPNPPGPGSGQSPNPKSHVRPGGPPAPGPGEMGLIAPRSAPCRPSLARRTIRPQRQIRHSAWKAAGRVPAKIT